MAFVQFAIIAIAVIVVPNIAGATEYVVGDDKGWTTGVDYQAWASDKMFNVGDTLVFKYKPTEHNVIKVNGTAFKDCSHPPDAEILISGNDIVVLKTAGKKWYLCGKPGHCLDSQKLVITVMDMKAPEPSPSSGGVISFGVKLAGAAFALISAFY